jgi:hypothetical protein
MSEERMHTDAAEANAAQAGGSENLPPIPGLKPGVPRVVPGSDNHWLTRPSTVRRLWWVFGAILALTVLAQFFIPIKGKFTLESTFGFAAWFGFFACVAMVLAAKVLGWWLKRPEDYYAEDDPAIARKERDDA